MNYVIAMSYFDSTSKLSGPEQKAVNNAVKKFTQDPLYKGLNFERIKASADPGMHTIRANKNIRVVVHKSADNYSFCYADQHDPATKWAQSHVFKINAELGAARLVDVIEEQVEVAQPNIPCLFDKYPDNVLIDAGVKPEVMAQVRAVQCADDIILLLDIVSEKTWDKLYELIFGQPVEMVSNTKVETTVIPQITEIPRMNGIRLLPVDNTEDLERALEFPMQQWIVFLHPTQRDLVERQFNGPARISGSAGTGKTIVALHRAAYLVRKHPTHNVLLTTFSRALATRLGQQADILMGTDSIDRKRLTITNLHSLAVSLLEANGQDFINLERKTITQWLKESISKANTDDLTLKFFESEWDAVIDPWAIKDWGTYRDLPRIGRSTALGARRRKGIWDIFEKVISSGESRSERTFSQLCRDVANLLNSKNEKPYDHVIVDESQDFGPTELSLIRALVKEGSDDLMLCGDNGQRIYKSMTSWRSQGINVVGRSHRLKINYRTSEEIRQFADNIVSECVDPDQDEKETRNTVSLFSGVSPTIQECSSEDDEANSIQNWVQSLLSKGYKPGELGIFGRTKNDVVKLAEARLKNFNIPTRWIQETDDGVSNSIALGTMHVAKGLEFPAVAIVGCSANRLPLTRALQDIVDPADHEAAIEKERNLLYVAVTRARENLAITYHGKPSTFLPTTN